MWKHEIGLNDWVHRDKTNSSGRRGPENNWWDENETVGTEITEIRPPPTSDECQPASSAPLSLVRRVIRPIQCSAALAAVKTHLGKMSHSFPVGSSSFLHTKDSRLRERNLPTSHTDRLPTNHWVVWTVHSTSWVILTYDVMSLPINTVILTWQHALQEKYTRH